MTTTAMLIAVLILLPAVVLTTWAWYSMAQLEEDLRAFATFEQIHFEIGQQATAITKGARWPTPG